MKVTRIQGTLPEYTTNMSYCQSDPGTNLVLNPATSVLEFDALSTRSRQPFPAVDFFIKAEADQSLLTFPEIK